MPNKTPLLFTPGPLTTSQTTKEAMLRDLGSRDSEFIEVVRELRRKLLEIGGVADAGYEAVPMQGSGTMAVESVFSSAVPAGGHVLVVDNGAYWKRMAKICSVLKITATVVEYPEDSPPDPARISALLAAHPGVTHVAVVHCETSTGMLNPVREIGEIVSGAGREYIVDAMSSFGGIPFNLAECRIDYMISSANKCLEGVPGFAFVLARRTTLLQTQGYARSLSFDLLAQWKGLETSGQFRFTPPTHAILACYQAIRELEQEGGVAGRARRYAANRQVLRQGMSRMGFREYLQPEYQSDIITSYLYPDKNFDFEKFYQSLARRGFVIYPGKVSNADCFRIGTIGRIHPTDISNLLVAIREVLNAGGITAAAGRREPN